MNLVVDYGNTRIKAAIFSGDELSSKHLFQTSEDLKKFFSSNRFESAIISTVSVPAAEIATWINSERKFILDHTLPLPINNLYLTPATLGMDRLAAVCGALRMFPSRDCLVVDAGTCITYDFLDRNRNYHGGAISPGINMRFEAMHTFTKRLPLVSAARAELIGNTTETSMRSGVMNGVMGELNGFIENYQMKYPDLRVVLCGGDTPFFENNLKHTIFAAPDLVLIGLNRILSHNASL